MARNQKSACLGLPCVIAVLVSDVVRDTHEPRIIFRSLGFPCCFDIYFAQHSAIYLHLCIVSRRNSGLDP